MAIWVPPKVSAELRENSRRYEAEVFQSLERDERLEHWDRLLKDIDPRLYLVKARNPVKAGTALRPGFWHVIRDNSDKGAPPSVMTIEGPNEEYVEPTSALFELLKRNDLCRPGAKREREAQAEKIRQAEEREREREREDMIAEATERFLAGNRAFVSMSKGTPWTQTAKAKRAARKKV